MILHLTINGCIGQRHNHFDFLLSREKRVVSPAIASKAIFQQIASITNNLKTSFINGEINDFGDFAMTVVDNIPYVNDIVSLFKSKPSEKAEIQSALSSINNNLKTVTNEIADIGGKVKQILQILQLSVFQTQVAEDAREITSCHADFLQFLKEPESMAEKDRLINCYDRHSYTRDIGKILNNGKISVSQKQLFEQIIENSGYCNGSEINHVFRYLFGLYIDGCTALTAAEALKYNETSTTLKDECTNTINSTMTFISNFYDRCSAQPCTKIKQPIARAFEETGVKRIMNTLNETFPWFFFSVFLFDDNKSIKKELFSGEVNRLEVLNKNGFIHGFVFWLPYQNQNKEGDNQYGIKFDKDALKDYYNGLNLMIINSPDGISTSFVGFHQSVNTLQEECKLLVNPENHNQVDSGSLSTGSIVGTVIGSVVGFIGIIVGFVLFCCFRK